MSTALACDMGGTRIKLGLVRGNKLIAQRELPAHAERGLAAAIQRISRPVRGLCREAGISSRDLGGFALAFPGIIAPQTGRILSTPAGKFDDARDLNVDDLIRSEIGLETLVCNDANAALAGEWRFGAARDFSSAVMMTLGTGIGTSAIIEGVPLRGRHGQAGCLGGHWTTTMNGRACRCGNLGCAESEASTWALPMQASADPRFEESRLAQEEPLDFEALFRAAEAEDALAIELRDRAVGVWAATLVSLIHAYDPECAVIGGGVMHSARVILPRLRCYAAHHAWTPWGRVRIHAAALGNDAGMLGAAWLMESRV